MLAGRVMHLCVSRRSEPHVVESRTVLYTRPWWNDAALTPAATPLAPARSYDDASAVQPGAGWCKNIDWSIESRTASVLDEILLRVLIYILAAVKNQSRFQHKNVFFAIGSCSTLFSSTWFNNRICRKHLPVWWPAHCAVHKILQTNRQSTIQQRNARQQTEDTVAHITKYVDKERAKIPTHCTGNSTRSFFPCLVFSSIAFIHHT